MSIDVAGEDAKTAGRTNYAAVNIVGLGDPGVQGFCREFSVNVGEPAHFSCTGDSVEITIYRIGWYGGDLWREIARVTNTPANQPQPVAVPGSNGAVTCTAWSTTATWDVPSDAVSGMYVALLRTPTGDRSPNGSWIPFVVRDDDAVADIIYKTSDATWALAYNAFGHHGVTPAAATTADLTSGKCYYGYGVANITDRCHFATYHVPIVTRQNVPQTYWYSCEFPLIQWLERQGYRVKYVSSLDLDRQPGIMNGGVFISSGHDEYWSANMRIEAESYRDVVGGHQLYMSGNEVFWKVRFTEGTDLTNYGPGAWCFKDTMPGPDSHVAGTPLDPVEWTGTWRDHRWASRDDEAKLTGTDFRMNGVHDFPATILTDSPAAALPVWRNSALIDSNITFEGVIGMEADELPRDTSLWQPSENRRVLASYTRNIDGIRADDNGQNYDNNGDLEWGIVSQRYKTGAVTVGFGTCQWSWALAAQHDRGGNYVQPAAQQFMTNLLCDLGATAHTLHTGLVAATPVSLDEYGERPRTRQDVSIITGGTPVTTRTNMIVDGAPVETTIW